MYVSTIDSTTKELLPVVSALFRVGNLCRLSREGTAKELSFNSTCFVIHKISLAAKSSLQKVCCTVRTSRAVNTL